ncbi:MAG: epoxyqueuosine reductase [archaeon]|nr:epoxyqueuosine reductase [archaeon]
MKEEGAISVGFLNQDSMKGGPPSADITSDLPEAQSAISFALPLDKTLIQPFLGKEMPLGRVKHERNNIETYLNIYKAAYKVEMFLKRQGYKAKVLIPNFKYRKDNFASEITSFPIISLRYMAVRSGVGSFGWSGNVGIKGPGAAIILGGLSTNAILEPTDPIPEEDSFCNKCKLCVKVCPYRMFDDKETFSIKLGEFSFSYAKRIDLYRCFISCGGYSGLDKTGNWSTWSPGRVPYCKTNKEMTRALINKYLKPLKWSIKNETGTYNIQELHEDPVVKNDENLKKLLFSKENKSTLKMLKNTVLTCGNCQLICSSNKEETAENYKTLINSGCVIINDEGNLSVLSPEEANQEFMAKGGEKKEPLLLKPIISLATLILTRIYDKYLKT